MQETLNKKSKPKMIDKISVTASDETDTAAGVGRIRLRSCRKPGADKPSDKDLNLLW